MQFGGAISYLETERRQEMREFSHALACAAAKPANPAEPRFVSRRVWEMGALRLNEVLFALAAFNGVGRCAFYFAVPDSAVSDKSAKKEEGSFEPSPKLQLNTIQNYFSLAS